VEDDGEGVLEVVFIVLGVVIFAASGQVEDLLPHCCSDGFIAELPTRNAPNIELP
jgi:hypothetical protein